MRILVAAIIGWLGLTPAALADYLLAPRTPLKSLGMALETAAGEFDLATRISKGICDANRPVTCIFIGEGQIEIRGTAGTADSPPTRITLLYRDRGPAWPLALNVGLLVSVVEPAMDRDDRYALTMRIVDLAGQHPSHDIINGQNARFTIAEVGGETRITAEPARALAPTPLSASGE